MVKSQLIRRVALTFRRQYSNDIQKSVEVMLDEISAALEPVFS
jgi:nucleoid DNA-binding protein